MLNGIEVKSTNEEVIVQMDYLKKEIDGMNEEIQTYTVTAGALAGVGETNEKIVATIKGISGSMEDLAANMVKAKKILEDKFEQLDRIDKATTQIGEE